MKRWALVTIALYLLLLIALTVPLAAALEWDGTGGGFMGPPRKPWPSVAQALRSAADAYREAAYWIILAVFGLCQALLLIVPVRDAHRRPPKKRHVLPTVIAGAFFMGLLCMLLVGSVLMAAFGDRALEFWWGHLALGLGMWVLWFFVFRSFCRNADTPRKWMHEVTMYLYFGSILELIVAVNAHVVCRKRDDCCAPFVTGLGIAAGVAVALMSFGPGVFYLFADRKRRITARAGHKEGA